MMLAFAVIAALILAAAAVAMSLRNVIHSALLLIGSWFGIAMFYLWAGAEFVAFAQVLVYVGAVSMVVLFAVLLTRRTREDLAIRSDSKPRAVTAILIAASVAAVLVGAVLGTPLGAAAAQKPELKVVDLGKAFAGPHAAAVLVAGVILTVALIGAVVLAATEKSSREEDVS